MRCSTDGVNVGRYDKGVALGAVDPHPAVPGCAFITAPQHHADRGGVAGAESPLRCRWNTDPGGWADGNRDDAHCWAVVDDTAQKMGIGEGCAVIENLHQRRGRIEDNNDGLAGGVGPTTVNFTIEMNEQSVARMCIMGVHRIGNMRAPSELLPPCIAIGVEHVHDGVLQPSTYRNRRGGGSRTTVADDVQRTIVNRPFMWLMSLAVRARDNQRTPLRIRRQR